MASTATPYGFRPLRHEAGMPAGGAMPTEEFRIKANYSGVIPYGAPVRMSLTNDPSSSFGAGYIVNVSGASMIQSSVPDYYVGIFVGCQYTNPTNGQPQWDQWYPGSVNATDITAYVVTDPGAALQVQASAASFDAYAAVGTSFPIIIPGTPYNAGSKNSTISLDTSGSAASTAPFKVMGIAQTPDNANATGYVDVIVKVQQAFHIYTRAL